MERLCVCVLGENRQMINESQRDKTENSYVVWSEERDTKLGEIVISQLTPTRELLLANQKW